MRRRRRTRTVIAILALASVAAAGATAMSLGRRSGERLAETSRRDGLAAHDRGDHRAAVIALSHALSRRSDDLEALVSYAESRARVAARDGEGAGAAASAAARALALVGDEGDDTFLARIAAVGERTGAVALALEAAERALVRNTDDVEALARIVRLRSGEPNDEPGRRSLERLVALEPDRIEWRAMRLERLRAEGAPLDARLELCREWERNAGDGARDGRYLTLEAALLAEAGEVARARSLVVEACDRGARSPLVLRLELRLLDAMRADGEREPLDIESPAALDAAEARLLEAARREIGDRSVTAELVQRAWLAGHLDEAIGYFGGVDAVEWGCDLEWRRALLHVERGDSGDAIRAIEALDAIERTAAGEAPDERDRLRAWVAALRAVMLAAQEATLSPVAAVRACAEAVAIAPDDAVLHALLGSAWTRARESDLAAASYERAIALERTWLAPRRELAALLIEMGRPAEAIDALLDIERRLARPDPELARLIERARANTPRPREAIPMNVLDATIRELESMQAWSDPDVIRRAIERLEALVGADAPRVAVARAREVIAFAPHDRARVAEAKRRVASVLRVTPRSLDGLLVMSELALLGDGADSGEALRYARQAADLHPSMASASERVVDLAQRAGADDIAREYARRLERVLVR